MTKQDILDIIQLLDTHFDSIGKEVRDELTFKFEHNNYGHFVTYDQEELFILLQKNEYDNLEETPVDSISDNLIICYTPPYKFWGEDKPLELLEEEFKMAEFNLKTYHLLSKEFKVILVELVDETFFTLYDSESEPVEGKEEEIEERISLKKFNQFK